MRYQGCGTEVGENGDGNLARWTGEVGAELVKGVGAEHHRVYIFLDDVSRVGDWSRWT